MKRWYPITPISWHKDCWGSYFLVKQQNKICLAIAPITSYYLSFPFCFNPFSFLNHTSAIYNLIWKPDMHLTYTNSLLFKIINVRSWLKIIIITAYYIQSLLTLQQPNLNSTPINNITIMNNIHLVVVFFSIHIYI